MEKKGRRRPRELTLSVALLVILAARAVIWALGDWLLLGGTDDPWRTAAYWLVFGFSAAAAVGLLLVKRWGRWLALAVCSGYSILIVSRLISAWASAGLEAIGPQRAAATVLEAAVIAGGCWIYLTRPDVLGVFARQEG